ncbi:hypothetical protein Nepgr_014794 [Nepenthes gracilis]|uniref:Uncharacterized protein n=1 Tax=Nepenthes gracilis TaxID=150966 RepID=A0AAD3SKN4_NEPGR|nr:hypothetical protein Nepgr_014794 [Nepenthes gracilis]
MGVPVWNGIVRITGFGIEGRFGRIARGSLLLPVWCHADVAHSPDMDELRDRYTVSCLASIEFGCLVGLSCYALATMLLLLICQNAEPSPKKAPAREKSIIQNSRRGILQSQKDSTQKPSLGGNSDRSFNQRSSLKSYSKIWPAAKKTDLEQQDYNSKNPRDALTRPVVESTDLTPLLEA